jgi:hypothetical protein
MYFDKKKLVLHLTKLLTLRRAFARLGLPLRGHSAAPLRTHLRSPMLAKTSSTTSGSCNKIRANRGGLKISGFEKQKIKIALNVVINHFILVMNEREEDSECALMNMT